MPTLTVDAHREQMMQALEAGNGYRFLTMAAPYLDLCPDDHHVRLMAIREYLTLGLTVPARELLDVDSSMVELPPEFVTVRQSLANLADKPIPWLQYAERYEGNLGSLAGRGVDVTPIREAWDRLQNRYQLFRDANGVDQVRMCDERGRWRWIPFLGDHKAVDEARPLPEDVGKAIPSPVLFEGLGRSSPHPNSRCTTVGTATRRRNRQSSIGNLQSVDKQP